MVRKVGSSVRVGAPVDGVEVGRGDCVGRLEGVGDGKGLSVGV